MSEQPQYLVLAFYHFTLIPNPHQEVVAHKSFFENKDLTSRIYISEQGINGQMSGKQQDAEAYMDWLRSNPLFKSVQFKIHHYHENVFPRQTIKYRKKLVAIDEEVNLSQIGEHVSPERWKLMLEEQEKALLLDVRNDYEWEVGRFDGAVCPPCATFREFGQYAEKLKNEVDTENTPIMMYCTGGIRCELYSSLLLKHGFKKVYQLDGGIINYGLKQGNDHWMGKLFVFDDRMTVPIAETEKTPPIIGQCFHCHCPNESYYNCASMDCNTLFLCCPNCLPQFKGCCSIECREAPRIRPYHELNPHKPFRKAHHYFQDKKPD